MSISTGLPWTPHLSCLLYPLSDSVFLETLHSGEVADPAALNDQRQSLRDRIFWDSLTKEDRPGSFGEGLAAGFASNGLHALCSLTKLLKFLLFLTVLMLSNFAQPL